MGTMAGERVGRCGRGRMWGRRRRAEARRVVDDSIAEMRAMRGGDERAIGDGLPRGMAMMGRRKGELTD
jgi:hypothetical protein